MKTVITKKQKKDRRHARVRSQITGSAERPRLSVYRSLQHIEAQLIDDLTSTTIVSLSDRKLKGTKTEKAKLVGEKIAKLAQDKKITAVVFDRGGFKYHGRVKALAESARQAGLKF